VRLEVAPTLEVGCRVGFGHAFGFEGMAVRPGMGWLRAVGPSGMRAIGILEILGGVGLIVPAVVRVQPWLTPTAAALLALLMVFAAAFHARRPGESRNIATNLILGVFAADRRLRPVRRRAVLSRRAARVARTGGQCTPGRRSLTMRFIAPSASASGSIEASPSTHVTTTTRSRAGTMRRNWPR
jgi:hypothetical protein